MYNAGIVLAFGVPCPKGLVSLAKNRDVKVLSHNVIYRMLDMLGVSWNPSVDTYIAALYSA